MARKSKSVSKAEMGDRTEALAVSALSLDRGAIPLPADYADYSETYCNFAYVFACVRAISNGIAQVPWRLRKGGELVFDSGSVAKKGTYGLDDRAAKLLLNPNENETWFDLIESTSAYLELVGNAYWEIVRDELGVIKYVYSVRPDRMRILPRADGKGTKGYEFRVNNRSKVIPFAEDEILHFRTFNPANDWYGLGTISPAADNIVLQQYCNKYNKNFFKNDATPRGYLYTDLRITKKQQEEIRESWSSVMGGVDNAYKMPVLPAGLKYMQLGANQKDMQFLNLIKNTREEILSSFGVPPAKVGLLEYAKYDNYWLQERAFHEDTLSPKLVYIKGRMDKFLHRYFSDEYEFFFDQTKFLREDVNDKVDRFMKLFGMGGITSNEVIDMLGIGEPFDGGDVHYVSAVYMPMGDESVSETERRNNAVIDEIKGDKKAMEKLKGKIHELLERNGGNSDES